MTLATLLVNLDLGAPNQNLLKVTGDLAERFHANVIGIAAGRLVSDVYNEGFNTGDFVQINRDTLDVQIRTAEAEFRGALQTRLAAVSWRCSIAFESAADYVATEARCADLVLTSASMIAGSGVNTNALLMQIGRPVLFIPSAIADLPLAHVLVAWRDTRESRRAVLDSLPILHQAARVSVFIIAARDEMRAARTQVDDVVSWLSRHGIAAEPLVSCKDGHDAAALDEVVREQKADLVVAGAFGHSRLQEWVLGGFTRHLLNGTHWCALVSH